MRRHVLYDAWTDTPDRLAWAPPWEALLVAAAREAGATVLGTRFHQFEPQGLTGVILLAESHLSLHTWPEEGLLTLDCFTCGAMDADVILDRVRAHLQPTRERITHVERGRPRSPHEHVQEEHDLPPGDAEHR